MVFWRISRFQPIHRMCLLPHICTILVPLIDDFLPVAARTVWLPRVHITSHHSDPYHTGHGTQNCYYPYYPIPPPPPHGYSLIIGRHILGIPHSPCQSGILHRRRQLLMPSINTEDFWWASKKKVQLDDVLALCFVLSYQSLSLSFLFDTVFVIWFSQSCFLVIALAVHALSFPFSNRCAF